MTTTTDAEACRAKCDDLLRHAAETSNMADRGRLIDEATWWRLRADDLGVVAPLGVADPLADWLEDEAQPWPAARNAAR